MLNRSEYSANINMQTMPVCRYVKKQPKKIGNWNVAALILGAIVYILIICKLGV
jgi:hypothetical protein